MKPALRAVGSRVLQSLVVIWIAYTIAFLLLHVLPGDAVLAKLSSETGNDVSEEQLEALRQQYGLGGSLLHQYVGQLGRLIGGDLGDSMFTGRPVLQVIAEGIPQTFLLALVAFVIAMLAGFVIGFCAVATRRRWLRGLLQTLPSVGVSLPTFWVGLLLIFFVSFGLGWLPAGGTAGFDSLLLPAISLSIVPASLIAQVFARTLEEVSDEAFFTVAAAKGASRMRLLLVHGVRNAMLPVLTLAGVVAGNLLTGSVVVETVFSRSGIGRVLIDAVQHVDLTVVQGLVLLGALLFIGINLAVDLLFATVDPRLRRQWNGFGLV